MAVAVSNSVLVRSSWSHRENVPAKGVSCGRLGGAGWVVQPFTSCMGVEITPERAGARLGGGVKGKD